jgi:hypothetical protein
MFVLNLPDFMVHFNIMFVALYTIITRLVKKFRDDKGRSFIIAFTEYRQQFYSIRKVTSIPLIY